MNLFRNKQCPRCGTKMPVEIMRCPQCQLNYQKFNSATNAEAKAAMRVGEKDRVLMRKGRPSDVNFIKLLTITILFGFAGGHYYYVGRNKMGIFFTAFFLIGVVNGIISTLIKETPTGEVYEIFTFLVLIWGFVIMLWIIDIAKVCFNKFKIPVSRN